MTEYLKSKGVCDNQACTFRINDAINRGPRMDETLRVEVRCLCGAGMVRGAGWSHSQGEVAVSPAIALSAVPVRLPGRPTGRRLAGALPVALLTS